MARLLLIALLLTVAVVPVASAEVPSQDHAPTFSWLDALWNKLDWLFSWGSPERIETNKSGAYIIVHGVNGTTTESGAYIIVDGVAASTTESGAYIIVTGTESTTADAGDN